MKLGIKRRIDRIAKALTRLEKITSLPLEKIIEDELESMLERGRDSYPGTTRYR